MTFQYVELNYVLFCWRKRKSLGLNAHASVVSLSDLFYKNESKLLYALFSSRVHMVRVSRTERTFKLLLRREGCQKVMKSLENIAAHASFWPIPEREGEQATDWERPVPG